MTFHRPLDHPAAIFNGFDPEEGDNTTGAASRTRPKRSESAVKTSNGPYRIIGHADCREVPLDRLRAGTMTDEEAVQTATKTLRLLNHPHVQSHAPSRSRDGSERPRAGLRPPLPASPPDPADART